MTIVVLALTSISSMAFGLYAGKKRERGLGWARIVSDCAADVFTAVSTFLRTITWPFRKGEARVSDAPKTAGPGAES